MSNTHDKSNTSEDPVDQQDQNEEDEQNRINPVEHAEDVKNHLQRQDNVNQDHPEDQDDEQGTPAQVEATITVDNQREDRDSIQHVKTPPNSTPRQHYDNTHHHIFQAKEAIIPPQLYPTQAGQQPQNNPNSMTQARQSRDDFNKFRELPSPTTDTSQDDDTDIEVAAITESMRPQTQYSNGGNRITRPTMAWPVFPDKEHDVSPFCTRSAPVSPIDKNLISNKIRQLDVSNTKQTFQPSSIVGTGVPMARAALSHLQNAERNLRTMDIITKLPDVQRQAQENPTFATQLQQDYRDTYKTFHNCQKDIINMADIKRIQEDITIPADGPDSSYPVYKLVKMISFSSKTTATVLQKIAEQIEIHRLSYAQIKILLSHCLSGEAYSEYNLMNRAGATIPEILKHLSQRFGTKTDLIQEEVKLQTFQRLPGETLEAVKARLTLLINKTSVLYPLSERKGRKTAILNNMLPALLDPATARHIKYIRSRYVRQNLVPDIEDLYSEAIDYEAAEGESVNTSSLGLKNLEVNSTNSGTSSTNAKATSLHCRPSPLTEKRKYITTSADHFRSSRSTSSDHRRQFSKERYDNRQNERSQQFMRNRSPTLHDFDKPHQLQQQQLWAIPPTSHNEQKHHQPFVNYNREASPRNQFYDYPHSIAGPIYQSDYEQNQPLLMKTGVFCQNLFTDRDHTYAAPFRRDNYSTYGRRDSSPHHTHPSQVYRHEGLVVHNQNKSHSTYSSHRNGRNERNFPADLDQRKSQHKHESNRGEFRDRPEGLS